MTDPSPTWYQATATLMPPQPPLRDMHKADVAIVGAGYTGLSAALHLAERGLKVIVLERGRIADGASGRNGGQIHTGQRRDQMFLEQQIGASDAHKLWDLAEEAKRLVHQLIARYHIACDLRPGLIIADHKRRHVTQTHAYARHLAETYGYDQIELLDRDRIQDLVGAPGYYGGTLDHGAGHLHPLNFALGLARAALAAGVRIHEQTTVTRFEDHHGVTLETATGARVSATHLLLCGNGLMDGLDRRVDAHVMSINNYIAVTEPLGDRALDIIANGAAVADSRYVVNYFRLTPDGRLLFGGGESYRRAMRTEVTAFVRPFLLRVFPQLKDVALDYGWGGTLGITMTRLPFVRRLSPHVLASAGYSGQGVALAPLFGKILAEAIAGQIGRLDLLERLPVPAFPGGVALRYPLLVAGLTYYALRDRL